MKEKFIAFIQPNLRTTLSQYKQQIQQVYGEQPPLAEALANKGPSGVIKEVSPGYSILLPNEGVANYENSLILIDEIFSQLDTGEQNLTLFEHKIEDLITVFEKLKQHIRINLQKLEETNASAVVQLTLIENSLKEIEQFSSDLDSALKENEAIINRNQAAINKCCDLFFPKTMKVVDSTLSEHLRLIKEKSDQFRKEISKLTEEISQKQTETLKKPDDPVQQKQEKPILESVSQEVSNKTLSDHSIQEMLSGVHQIESNPAQNMGRIQLHNANSFAEYTQKIISAVKNREKSGLLDGLINYKDERWVAIGRLVYQLALSLALNESEEKIHLLYRWIEICRGILPGYRLLDQDLFEQKDLELIHLDPVLREIYFKLPRILQADLSHTAEQRAQETNIIDSVRSIDDLTLDEDQILLQWSRFISQEEANGGIPNFSAQPALIALMHNLNDHIANPHLNARITNPPNEEGLAIIALWKRQLRAVYKIYQVAQGIPSEKRLLTQEPLTEEEYQLIQNDRSFSNIFRSLDETVQEELRQEYYRSSVLHVLAGYPDDNAPVNLQGLLEHDKGSETDYILKGGETEFTRGFRFLIEGEFLQYKLKYESKDGLANILINKGFTPSEANSIVGFIREQKVYYIFLNFLASRANAITGKVYSVKELPEYVNIYKLNGKVYFEVTSGPWSFMCPEDELFFPDQKGKDAQEKSKNIENFYDAEFKLCYELVPGRKITDDALQLIQVTTDSKISWQLLNFESLKWRALDPVKRYIANIDKTMIALRHSDPMERTEAKIKIEQWLDGEKRSLDLKDYELIQMHLQAISEVNILSLAIGRPWLEFNLNRCAERIKEKHENVAEPKKQESLFIEASPLASFDAEMVFHELICQKSDRVMQAKRKIEDFLSSDDPSLIQCRRLQELLYPLLSKMMAENSISLLNEKMDVASAENEQNLCNREWLQTQIGACNSRIRAADDEAFDVRIVISELMDKKNRTVAIEKINAFLQASTQDLSKRIDLAELLTIYNGALQKKDDEDPAFIQWLSDAVGAAKSGLPESRAKLSSSSSDLISRIKKETPAVSSSSSLVERDRQTISSSSSSNPQASSSSSSSLRGRVPHFFSALSSRLSRKESQRSANGDRPPSPP